MNGSSPTHNGSSIRCNEEDDCHIFVGINAHGDYDEVTNEWFAGFPYPAVGDSVIEMLPKTSFSRMQGHLLSAKVNLRPFTS